MKIFYCDHFVLPLPPGHRFPMRKYALLRARIIEAGLHESNDLCEPPAATDAQLRRVHTADYVERMKAGEMTPQEIRRIGFPWSLQMVERSRRSVGGTIAAARAAMEDGVSVNLAGGTHHAFADRGEGFCVFNDCAVAARDLQADGSARRIAILDCDVHQGNGTADIFAGDASVLTLSIHGERNFPLRKTTSDIDVELPDGATDLPYLDAVDRGVREALRQAQPDVAFYVSGADPFVGDRLGRLAVTKAGLAERDAIVLEHCRSAGVPVTVVMGGGYAPDPTDIVDIHFQTVLAAKYASVRLTSLTDTHGSVNGESCHAERTEASS